MRSFYAEVRLKNTNTIRIFHVLARNFDEAALTTRAYIAGFNSASVGVMELIGLASSKRRGAQVEELL